MFTRQERYIIGAVCRSAARSINLSVIFFFFWVFLRFSPSKWLLFFCIFLYAVLSMHLLSITSHWAQGEKELCIIKHQQCTQRSSVFPRDTVTVFAQKGLDLLTFWFPGEHLNYCAQESVHAICNTKLNISWGKGCPQRLIFKA